MTYYTKDGKEIEMIRNPDAEKENRGWIVKQIDAYVGDERVGYLKISSIPEENFVIYYNSIYCYAHLIQGKFILPISRVGESTRDFDYKTLPFDEMKAMLKNVVFTFKFVPWGKEGEYVDQFTTKKELIRELKKYENLLMKMKLGRNFKDFKKYQGQPFVDYIRVFDGWKRQGIATAMYHAGSVWMKERGMVMTSSTLQSPEAQATWKHLAKIYDVRPKQVCGYKKKYINLES